MTDLVIHPVAETLLDSLKNHLPQSLLLTGESGVGLRAIARELAGKQLAAEILPQDAKEHTESKNGTITVEIIRRLYDQTRAKHTMRQVIIIDDADSMSLGAQAAFLKLLEEPNSHIYFILTSHTPSRLLPTIRSRVQQTTIQPITREQSSELITRLGVTDATKQAQLLFIAEGLPAEISRLIADDEYFKKRAAMMSDARLLLQAEPYEQLLVVQKYQSNKEASLELIDSALLVARRSLSAKPQTGLIKQLDKLLRIQTNIKANHSVRLQLASLVV